jgi:hypothetical protein
VSPAAPSTANDNSVPLKTVPQDTRARRISECEFVRKLHFEHKKTSSYVHFIILSDLKCHVSLTSQALEIIFEVQRKKSDQNITTRKISFPTYKTRFFFFFWFCLELSYFQTL